MQRACARQQASSRHSSTRIVAALERPAAATWTARRAAGRTAVQAPALAHAQQFLTPLQAPTSALQPSHQSISLPLGSVELFGNYSVLGPAIIHKVNNALVALVQPGGAVSVLNSSSTGPTTVPCASLSHDDDAAVLITLSGRHLELDGGFSMANAREGIQHGGKTILSLGHLSEDNTITLGPDGCLSHPVNVHPQPRAAAVSR